MVVISILFNRIIRLIASLYLILKTFLRAELINDKKNACSELCFKIDDNIVDKVEQMLRSKIGLNAAEMKARID